MLEKPDNTSNPAKYKANGKEKSLGKYKPTIK